MKILMVTNTYAPHVGGVARSVASFSEEYRRRGHQVLVVAPKFRGSAGVEVDVVRSGAIKNFNGSEFSVVLPPRLRLTVAMDAFAPDVVHSHHPFLLGTTAARLARSRAVPLVFTHHTLYERYTHYVPGDSDAMRRLAVRVATRYANRCDAVFAPSESLLSILRQRGVTTPATVVPTGICLEDFATGDRAAFRRRHDLPQDAIVAGHVGRLAEEKNLAFLARALAAFLAATPRAYALVVGDGPSREEMRSLLMAAGVAERVRFAGTLSAAALVDAYHAIDVFAFSSLSETQGMVLAEAMASGVPVVALDAPNVREIVCDNVNGRLVDTSDERHFADALSWIANLPPVARDCMTKAARDAAQPFSLQRSTDLSLATYAKLIAEKAPRVFGTATNYRRRFAAHAFSRKYPANPATARLRELP